MKIEGFMMSRWTLEDNVNDWVKSEFNRIGLVNGSHFGVESSMSDKLKAALKGGAKTTLKTGTGKPDFHVEIYDIPVVIENKLGLNKLSNTADGEIRMDEKSVQNYAVNGAVAYAKTIISSDMYDEVIAIGIAGDSPENVELKAYYVFSTGTEPKPLTEIQTLDFLENSSSFKKMLIDAKLTDKEKHQILISSQKILQQRAKSLNKLMNNHSINVEQRVVYVSGCLLAMQNVVDENGNIVRV